MIGDINMTMAGTKPKKMPESSAPSKFIAIPARPSNPKHHPSQHLTPDLRPSSQSDHALSLDLSSCSPGNAQTLYESPDPLAPSPCTPRVHRDSDGPSSRGFQFDLSPHFEQSDDLSTFHGSFGSTSNTGLGLHGDEFGTGLGLTGDQNLVGGGLGLIPDQGGSSLGLSGDPDLVGTGFEFGGQMDLDWSVETPIPANQHMSMDDDDDEKIGDCNSLIMSDIMLSSAADINDRPQASAALPPATTLQQPMQQQQPQPQRQQPIAAATPPARTATISVPVSANKVSWGEPVVSPSPPSSTSTLEKRTLHTLLLGTTVGQSVPKPSLSVFQQSPILTQQLSKSAPGTFQYIQPQPSPVLIPASSTTGTPSSSGPTTFLTPIHILNLNAQPQPHAMDPVVIQAANVGVKPAAVFNTSPEQQQQQQQPSTSASTPKVLQTSSPKVRSESPDSDASGGSTERRWEDVMEYLATMEEMQESAVDPDESKVKLEMPDVAYNPSEQLEESGAEDELYSGSDNDDNSDAESETSHSSFVEDFISAGRKKRYFWQYNMQSKGPKGKRLCKTVEASDPHVLNDFEDPVFDPELNEMKYKHNGKARRGDGNDITPSPQKLFNLGTELNQLNKKITCMTPVSELPAPARTSCRREKNKYASRACRLKKKAQHEANKLKLHGLKHEHRQLMFVLASYKFLVMSNLEAKERGEQTSVNFTDKLDKLCRENLRSMIAGHTAEYVNSVLEKVAAGDSAGGIYDDEQNTNSTGRSAVNCNSWA